MTQKIKTLPTSEIQRSPGQSVTGLIRKYLFKKPDTILIHVGKCGGLSLRAAFDQVADQLPTDVRHIKKPRYYPNAQYIILARDPISRLISAFNFRYRKVVEEDNPIQRHKIAGEYEVLTKYKSLNSIAEALYDTDGSANLSVHREIRIIRHIREDIGFYLKDFLKRCPPHQIVAVLMQESLDADIEKYLGVTPLAHKNVNSSSSRSQVLSVHATKNIRRFFCDDYAALLHLYCHGKIEPKTFLGILGNSAPNTKT